MEGHQPKQLRDLISRLTDAVELAVAAPREHICVCVREVPASHWATADVTEAEQGDRQQPAIAPTMD